MSPATTQFTDNWDFQLNLFIEFTISQLHESWPNHTRLNWNIQVFSLSIIDVTLVRTECTKYCYAITNYYVLEDYRCADELPRLYAYLRSSDTKDYRLRTIDQIMMIVIRIFERKKYSHSVSLWVHFDGDNLPNFCRDSITPYITKRTHSQMVHRWLEPTIVSQSFHFSQVSKFHEKYREVPAEKW